MYRRKPLEVEAVQWFKHGDHPAVARTMDGPTTWGTIYTNTVNMMVAPGDWIVKGVDGKYYPLKNSIFKLTYEVG